MCWRTNACTRPPHVARSLGELGLLSVEETITKQLEIPYLSRRLG